MANETRTRSFKGLNNRAVALIALHVLFLGYSFSGFLGKVAAGQGFLSVGFIAAYGGMLLILAVYAVFWQQIIKHLPLSLAYANKAITIVWGIVWGALFFGEQTTPLMIIGAIIVAAGVILFAYADHEAEGPSDDALEQPSEREAGDER